MTVTENPRRLEPVTADPFIAGLEPTRTAPGRPAADRSPSVRAPARAPVRSSRTEDPRPAERGAPSRRPRRRAPGRGHARQQRDPSAGRQHAHHLVDRPQRLRDEVQRGEAADGVEARVRERQRGRVAAHVASSAGCSPAPPARASCARRRARRRARRARARERPREVARPAADVEHGRPAQREHLQRHRALVAGARPSAAGASSGRQHALVDARDDARDHRPLTGRRAGVPSGSSSPRTAGSSVAPAVRTRG